MQVYICECKRSRIYVLVEKEVLDVNAYSIWVLYKNHACSLDNSRLEFVSLVYIIVCIYTLHRYFACDVKILL